MYSIITHIVYNHSIIMCKTARRSVLPDYLEVDSISFTCCVIYIYIYTHIHTYIYMVVYLYSYVVMYSYNYTYLLLPFTCSRLVSRGSAERARPPARRSALPEASGAAITITITVTITSTSTSTSTITMTMTITITITITITTTITITITIGTFAQAHGVRRGFLTISRRADVM